MAQITYRANLSAAIFPLTLTTAGRTVIIPGPDNNYDRRVDPEGEQKDAGIPQAIYLENVIPTASGYQSIGYVSKTALPATNYDSINSVYANRFDQVYKITVAWDSATTFKASNISGLDGWTDVIFSGTAVYPSSGRITSAIVRDVCYVFIRGASNQIYTAETDGVNLTLTNVTASLVGIVAADIVEICGSYNYLICIKSDGSVNWSSTTTPLTFTPSLITGAGSAFPNNSNNKLDNIEACIEGFYLYTPTGIIFSAYTGNSRYPWRFVPVNNTSPVISFSYGDINNSHVIVIDGSGSIRQVRRDESDLIAPEVSDYLRKSPDFDIYNSTTNVLSTQTNYTARPPRVYFMFDRYVLVSCDSTTTGYASIIWYDLQLKRYGKLKIAHSRIVPHDSLGLTTDKNNIGIIDLATGVCKVTTTEIDVTTDPHAGVLILGKFQYVRSRNLVLDGVNLEGKFHTFSSVVLPSLKGSTFDAAISPYIETNTSTLKEHMYLHEAKNHSIVCKGQFSISTLELNFHIGAAR